MATVTASFGGTALFNGLPVPPGFTPPESPAPAPSLPPCPLRDEILAKCPDMLASRDDGAIAIAVSAGRTQAVPTLIGIGSVLEALGPQEGAMVLDAISAKTATNSVVKWAWYLLSAGTLDISLPAVQTQIDALVAAGVMTMAQALRIKMLCIVPAPVTAQDVARALEGV